MSVVDPIPSVKIREWLEQKKPDLRPPIRHTRLSQSREDHGCAITFDGLTKKELDAFQAFESGAVYLRVIDGRLNAYGVADGVPPVEDDPIISPHWGRPGELKTHSQPPAGAGWHSPGIVITAVGAGCSHKEDRDRSVQTLRECGFVCLRSPRGEDGKYWEQWVLHSMLMAEGRLREHLDGWRKENKNRGWFAEVEEAARHIALTLNVSFGSLDITIQRWHLSVE